MSIVDGPGREVPLDAGDTTHPRRPVRVAEIEGLVPPSQPRIRLWSAAVESILWETPALILSVRPKVADLEEAPYRLQG